MDSIKEIRARFDEDVITAKEVETLRGDKRKGVQVLLDRYDRLLEKQQELEEMHRGMLSFENELHQAGYQMICGVDEVGRGPLAGPVTACACILPIDFQLLGLTDSKKITKAKREEFAEYIKENALAYQIASVSAQEIDKINILQATKKAMTLAITGLHKKADFLLLDAIELDIQLPQMSIIKGDAKSLSIAASSVLAKVWRDRYMAEMARKYPEYGFDTHAGYGTTTHLEAIREYGMTREHRRSFKPVLEIANKRLYSKE